MIDLVTIIHNDVNSRLAIGLAVSLEQYEHENHKLIIRDNTTDNIGFAKGCNEAFTQTTSQIVGFINPDVMVHGNFITLVENQFLDPGVMITGETFRPGKVDMKHNRLTNWVCGAALFVRRDWFISVGGFHEGYVWSWEETDLCKQAEMQGYKVKPIRLPLTHDRSHVNTESEEDKLYKDRGFKDGQRLYHARWY